MSGDEETRPPLHADGRKHPDKWFSPPEPRMGRFGYHSFTHLHVLPDCEEVLDWIAECKCEVSLGYSWEDSKSGKLRYSDTQHVWHPRDAYGTNTVFNRMVRQTWKWLESGDVHTGAFSFKWAEFVGKAFKERFPRQYK